MEEIDNIAEYYKARCSEIALTEENNKLLTKEFAALKDSNIIEYPLLDYDKKTGDVLIPVYGLDGHPLNYYKDNSGKLQSGKTKELIIRRFTPQRYAMMAAHNEREGKDAPGKYNTPQGALTYPWISPNIIYDYQAKKKIKTLIITEGAIKGICGYLNGLHIFAMSGIKNYRDKNTGQLHTSILNVIKECQVENVIVLFDGDCNKISLKAIEEGKDLYKRPHDFYSAVRGIAELLKDFNTEDRSIEVYFAHIDSDNINTEPKGLDDLYGCLPEEKTEITKELITYGKTKLTYFSRLNITNNAGKLYSYFHLVTAEVFYNYYNQIIKDKSFVFHGTKYKYDFEKSELNIEVPGSAKQYFRVGDNYYERLYIPNKHGQLEYNYHRRLSGTITQDHGKSILTHIEKFKAFCNKPDHVNYQPIIDNCFNRYLPFEHEPSDTDECPVIMGFLEHIFEEHLDLGLDYIQLLYQRPTQKLPILCLVSNENSTGKSTFGFLLKAIFTGNMTTIGNSDLENDFNGGWASRLIIYCEEMFADKKKVVERIKALSTADKISLNQKGVDQVEIDFFGKFIFNSNNAKNFIIANKNDERYWVRKIKPLKERNVHILEQMIEEVPNFLYYLNKRKMSTKDEDRMWIKFELRKTQALDELVEYNKSSAEKELLNYLRFVFLEMGFLSVQFTLKYIVETIFRKRFESVYIERILKENLELQPSAKVERFMFPELKNQFVDNKHSEEIVLMKGHGRPYTFNALSFLNEEEIKSIELSGAAISIGNVSSKGKQTELQGIITNTDKNDEPF